MQPNLIQLLDIPSRVPICASIKNVFQSTRDSQNRKQIIRLSDQQIQNFSNGPEM